MSIFDKIKRSLNIHYNEDNFYNSGMGVTIGVVVDTDDPLQMGRLRVYCPDLNDDPKKVQHLPWAIYASPFGGSIRNSEYTRGHIKDNSTTNGTTQYGFWAIPEMNANVLVMCINGDPRRRVWLGCIYNHKEVGGLFNGVYDWESGSGTPDGPFTAPDENNADERHKINPLYDNLSKAFDNDRKSAEWKTRGADYSGMVNTKIDSFGQHSTLKSSEDDEWVKEKLGAMGYDWSGFKNLGAYLASRIFGFMTPGLHSISFDDRPFNSRIRLRTTSGHQILLDDTNERIYISTYEGKSWLEMDINGNIDIFSDKRISVNSKDDINFSTDSSFRVKAKRGIYLYAGDTRGQSPLSGIPADGQIRLQSSNDMHIFTEGNLYHTVDEDVNLKVGGSIITKVDGNVETIIDGTYILNILQDYSVMTVGDYGISSESHSIDTNNFSVRSDGSSLVLDSDKTVLSGNATRIEGAVVQLGTGPSVNIELNPIGIVIVAPEVVTTTSFITEAATITPIEASLNINPALLSLDAEISQLTPWTNRVPEHEPWPRVMKQDGDDIINQENNGYKNNVDWIDQFDNITKPDGREPIGVIEGDERNERGDFWRR